MKTTRKSLCPLLHLALYLLLSLSFMNALASAEQPLLKQGHPQSYTVVQGDTLWDIAGYFLRDPWRWPDIWYVNPQVGNPHLIYPGDLLQLTYLDGKPRLQLTPGPRRVKLSPGVRIQPWDGSIPTIPMDAIGPFLSRPHVVDLDQLEHAPYIVSFADRRLLGGTGTRAYVRALGCKEQSHHVVRPLGPYRDADTDEVLGYEALYVGSVETLKPGDPATVFFNNSASESLIGDRLVTVSDDKLHGHFTPRRPDRPIEGSIIRVMNGLEQIGQYSVVVIDKGAADGLQPGHVLQIKVRGDAIQDPITKDFMKEVKLPDEVAGHLMIFRAFDRVSFGLVMHALRAMHVSDRVSTP